MERENSRTARKRVPLWRPNRTPVMGVNVTSVLVAVAVLTVTYLWMAFGRG